MLHIVSAMAYGDCFITLSLLELLGESNDDWQLLGTAVTRQASRLLNKPVPVIELLPDRAAFYGIKEYGPWKAASDFFLLKGKLNKLAKRGDRFAFERPDIRNSLVRPYDCQMLCAPQTHNAYADRLAWFKALFGYEHVWEPLSKPSKPVQSVLINPCARFGNRWLDPVVLDNLIGIAASRDWDVTLLDPCKRYGSYSQQVYRYESELSLLEAVGLLRGSDLYIGPDSFFIHLAYYFRVPMFGFFFPYHHDFLVPGMEEKKNFTDFDSARKRMTLETSLLQFVEPCSSALQG